MLMKKILIVDDEPFIRKMFRIILEKSGYTAIEADGPIEALTFLRGQEIGAVLLDIYMPKMNGLDLLSELKNEFDDMPVIMVTGATDIRSCAAAMDNGAVDYLEKPVKMRELLDAVEKALSGDIRYIQTSGVM